MLGLFDFVYLTYDNEKLIDFLIQHHVLTSTITCSECGNDITINKKTLMYRCQKRYYVKNVHKKRVAKQCNFYKSAKVGTWFHKSHLDVATICKIAACFLMLRHPRQDDTQSETGVSSTTVVDWFNFCREVCVFWAEKNSEKLGGPGHIVEIDEAKLGTRKYNRGRLIKGHWIFEGYEQDTKKVFIVPVEDRSEKTLLACIKEWILPGTTIVSDCWKSYNCLNNEDFQHLTVNHSYNFVDPDTGAHTQHIERVWREVRGNIPRYGTKEDHVLGYLCEFLFKRAHSRLERIETFFDIIGELYPPLSTDLESPISKSQEEPSTSTV
ncbi:uncharacterized protein LOC118644227 [Monomorium pharaonis]|uniref:uncharacterized protein LOC105840847 n=1 Tax=Monomorium pharaonis TaxID=307658 RepID=UPI001747527A|nr:uncharacterized protein LOC105840847 [Monomorium pharaonis]XP_036150829.1 uncharacterized protein LOC118644227 [Monomorium pharaonis]